MKKDPLFFDLWAYLDLSGMRPLVAIAYVDVRNDKRFANLYLMHDEEFYTQAMLEGKYFHGQRVNGKLDADLMFKIDDVVADKTCYAL